jgi:tetratricopeptide (TPR) repeat protein
MKCPKCHSENPADSKYCSKCATLLSPSKVKPISVTKTLEMTTKELSIGTIFAGRYQIIEEIGRGGMGRVYKVLDKDVEEKVALKLLNPEIAADEKIIKRFRNELKFARKITHKNVCRMFDLNEEEGTPYITMEYVPGEDLKSSVRRMGQLTIGKAISVAKQICEGLDEAHRLGVVHRDMKPQNIMIDSEGNAHIMDFGIALSVETKGVTEAGMIIGTPEYMSPEQVEGKQADKRSDVYSVGVIIYEMVTGRVPFEGDTALSIALKHKSEMPRNPKELNDLIPPDLNRLILKCMEKDREKRFQGADELLSELIDIEQGMPTHERVIPKRIPFTAREITVQFKMKKIFVPVAVVVALIIAGLVIWQLIPRKQAVPVSFPSDKPSLAVMYFENLTGDANLDHWKKAISDLLITDLAQSKYIKVMSAESLFNTLSKMNMQEAKSYSSDVLKEIAAQGGVEHVLVGKIMKSADAFRIDTILQKASTGEIIGSERAEGKGEESFFPMVDELTTKIKRSFRLSAEEIAGDIDKEVGRITTSSPEALKYYVDARKYHNKGDYNQSLQLMKKAVAIDPDFAMAYKGMASSYSNLSNDSEERKYLQKALELVDRVSDRERYLIQGDFYWQIEETFDKAIKEYRKLVKLYPDDRVANINLAILYSELEEWDKSAERFEVLKKSGAKDLFIYTNLAIVYWYKGNYEKAGEVLERYLNNISDNVLINGLLAYNYLFQKRYDRALVEVDKAISLDPTIHRNLYIKGDIYHIKGDLIQAEREYLKLIETGKDAAKLDARDKLGALYLLQGKFDKSEDQLKKGIELAKELGEKGDKSSFQLKLAYLYLKMRKLEEALGECNKAWSGALEAEELEAQRSVLHFKGLAQLEMDSVSEAQRTADELKMLSRKGPNKKVIRDYHHLTGMKEFKRKNFAKAIKEFEKAISLSSLQSSFSALFINSLALAYYEAGDLEKAREQNERIIGLTYGRLYYGDIYAKSYYMLGKIYKEKGLNKEALEQYRRFIDLWRETEHDFPEIADAKKQIAALQAL